MCQLSVKLLALAAVSVGWLTTGVFAAAVVKGDIADIGSGAIKGIDNSNGHELSGRQGPDSYGGGQPSSYVTIVTTFTAITVTVDVSSTAYNSTADAVTHAPTSSSVSNAAEMSTTTVAATSPSCTPYAGTGTDSHDCGLSSAPITSIQSSSVEGSLFTSLPVITLTTSIDYPASSGYDSNHTSTETVIVTPTVTMVSDTTVTPYMTTETSIMSGSTVTQTATVTVIVSPIPLGTSTTGCSEFDTGSYSAATTSSSLSTMPAISAATSTVATGSSLTTVSFFSVLTSTVTVSHETPSSTSDISPQGTTTSSSAATVTVTVTVGVAATSTTISTPCEESLSTTAQSTTALEVPTVMVTTTLTITNTPYAVSESVSWSVGHINGTMAGTGSFISMITGTNVEHTRPTQFPSSDENTTATTSTAIATVSASAGASSTKSPSGEVTWGNRGGVACVVMLVAVFSLVL